ncbi:hypothetical protein NS365_04550 [Aureimonas ureilytica]|uniref:Phage tail protein n=1 Tax=Aureimonas ureilytica TaxID=401562 RepID=A0A175RWS2_9HYPH|nr:hypothetical protein [Aureimonas ureilytica]KTR07332.1 hypothetical protein NS365_04550 [Aureimonas ureilytica]
MAVSVWPASLPQCFLLGTTNEAIGDGRIVSSMDVGPAKLRRRSSAMPGALSGRFRFTRAQLAVARDFLEVTLLGGVLPFRFPAQSKDGTVLVRLKEMPNWMRETGQTYSCELTLEVLP